MVRAMTHSTPPWLTSWKTARPIETALDGAQATVEVEIEEEVAAAPTPVAGLVVSQEMDAGH